MSVMMKVHSRCANIMDNLYTLREDDIVSGSIYLNFERLIGRFHHC